LTETLHPEETITSFLLIRHGDTRHTEEGRLYRDPEAPLTEKGVSQARAVGAWLPRQKPDVLLTSRSTRVRATADIVAAELSLEPIVIDGLDEWHIGQWEGRTYLDIKKSEPELYRAWSSDPIHNAPPGGESIADLCGRVRHSVDELIRRYEGKRAALVTHSGIIRGALLYALGIPVENFWRLMVPVGSITRVDFSANFATLHYLAFRPADMDGPAY